MTRVIQIECAHCHRVFEHPYRPGRRRLYCRRSCRQRAYECRHPPIAPPRGPWAKPKDPTTTPEFGKGGAPPPIWLGGTREFVVGKMHALRPGAPDGRGRVPTLCGTHARPSMRPVYGPHQSDLCRSCARLLHRNPPPSGRPPLFELLTAQGHLLDIGKALDESDRHPHRVPTNAELRTLLERALEPVEPWRGVRW